MDKYKFIVIYKTAYYSFYLPVALALHQLNIATPQNLKQAHDILIPLGEVLQDFRTTTSITSACPSTLVRSEPISWTTSARGW